MRTESAWDRADDVGNPELEWKLRAIAVPAAIGLAVVFHAFPLGHFVQRTWLTMMVHECGHAITALLCGFPAAPSLWKTMVADHRSTLATVLVAIVLVGLAIHWWDRDKRAIALCAAIAVVMQVWWTYGLTPAEARTLVTFGGDGGGMVLGTLLVCTFFAGRDSQLYRGALRWGFLVIGAAAYVDTFATWWVAQGDRSVIPFGEIEGVGLSDPSKLREAGWSTDDLVDRYVMLGVACAVVLLGVWAWQTWAARRLALTARADGSPSAGSGRGAPPVVRRWPRSPA